MSAFHWVGLGATRHDTHMLSYPGTVSRELGFGFVGSVSFGLAFCQHLIARTFWGRPGAAVWGILAVTFVPPRAGAYPAVPVSLFVDPQIVTRQFVPVLAMSRARFAVPALLHHVLHVVGGRPQKEVSRVYAGRVIAFVADVQAGRNRAVMDFPRNTVSMLWAAAVLNIAVSLVG